MLYFKLEQSRCLWSSAVLGFLTKLLLIPIKICILTEELSSLSVIISPVSVSYDALFTCNSKQDTTYVSSFPHIDQLKSVLHALAHIIEGIHRFGTIPSFVCYGRRSGVTKEVDDYKRNSTSCHCTNT